jgi:hypothetical protein
MDNPPKPELLKVVKIIECVPGHADRPDDSEDIAIIRLTHCGKPDHPLLITMKDTKKLVVELLKVLLYHGKPIPDELRDVLDGGPLESGTWGAVSQPEVRPPTRTDTPTKSISTFEAERFCNKMKRLTDDHQLLRCIGVTDSQIGGRLPKKYPKRKRR